MNNYKEKPIIDVLEDEFIPYASEILLNNLPHIGDGLLSSQRKVIYAMNEKGVTYDKPHIKMLRCSAMAFTYYIYGDMPLNAVMKNMGNNSLNYMYIDPKGNYGDKNKKDGVGASPRYIEARLSEYSSDLLNGINKKCIPYKRNFDNTCDEPIVLPSMFPNILINTSQSIAVSEASKIPAHNFNEVCDCFIDYIKNHDIESAKKHLKGCDLSTGGQIVYDENEFNKIYNTGEGSFTLVGKYMFDEKENKIQIYEIPYETYIETIDERLRICCEDGIFTEVLDIHDGSDKDGIRLDIYLKKNTNIETFIKKLRKHTPFQTKMSCNFTIIDIDNKTPVRMSLEHIINSWLRHRIDCIKNETSFDINKFNIELNKLYGLSKILESLDETIALIRSSKNDDDAKEKLIKRFYLNEEQAEYIASIKLININNEWIVKRIDRINELEKNVKELKSFMSDENLILRKIVEQLEYGKKKYGKERMTTILYDNNLSINDFVDDYNCRLVVTKQGYVKKTLVFSEKQKVKDGDEIVDQIQTQNNSKILIFTDKGNCYYYNTFKLQDTQPSNIGTYLPALLGLEDETIVYITATNDYNGYMLFAFENGKAVRIPMVEYKTKQNRQMIGKAYYTKSQLIYVCYLKENKQLLARCGKKYMVFESDLITVKSKKDSKGSQVIKGSFDEFHENTLSKLETPCCYVDKIGGTGKELDI